MQIYIEMFILYSLDMNLLLFLNGTIVVEKFLIVLDCYSCYRLPDFF